MSNQSDKDSAFERAHEVIKLAVLHKVPPTPRNYAVWYEYVAKSNKDLSKAIDDHMGAGKGFSEEFLDQMHFDHISNLGADAVEEATDDVQNMLSQILTSISNFNGNAVNAQKEMSANLEKMEAAAGEGDVQTIVEHLISSASSLKDSSGDLTMQLEESQREIDQLKEKLDMAKKESEIDFLTGLLNRKALDKRIAQQLDLAGDTGEKVSIMMIDIDHFKSFNDKYGHLIGDQVLKIVSKALKDSLKGSDIVARYGGEEFSVVLPGTPVGGAIAAAEAVRKNIASKELKRKDTGENYGQITVSIGVSMYRPDSDDQQSFIKRADEALYKSKQDGRNRVTIEAE